MSQIAIQPPVHRSFLALLAFFVTLLAAFSAVQLAFAHAHYDHSQPGIGQVLTAAPARADIYTDSEMRKTAGGNVITVVGPDGSRTDDGNTVVDDADRKHFSVGLNLNLPPGRYVVSFQTLSDVDGGTDHGRFAFYVGSGPTAEQQALDASLNGAAPVEGGASASGSGAGAGRIVAIVGAAFILLALVVAGGLVVRRKQSQARDPD